jgi:hypothetical protein
VPLLDRSASQAVNASTAATARINWDRIARSFSNHYLDLLST